MRKTLFAMLGLVALGLWALPALAVVSTGPQKDPPKAFVPIPMENRPGIWQQRAGGSYQGTLSGTLIKQAQATTTWYLYPGACDERAAGTWAPRSTPHADSLDTYTVGTTGPFGTEDLSLPEILWHVSDNATCVPGTNCPSALAGSRMIWCGKFDANWVVKYGYPNITYQILYIDTGSHAANYNFVFTYQFSTEFNYDFAYLIGGGDNAADPIGNLRSIIDNIINNGSAGNAHLLVRWTGSVTPAIGNATGGNTTGAPLQVQGLGGGSPSNVTGASYTIEAQHRALYLVFTADCLYSHEDGNWPVGSGVMIDNVSTSDNGSIYTDAAASGGVDSFSGNVLVGTSGAPIVSARVPPGKGALWHLVAGQNLPTADLCSPKSSATDMIFSGANAQNNEHTIPGQYNTLMSCSFPVATGVASVLGLWDMYLDLPRNQGYTESADYRIHKDGSWGNWQNTHGTNSVHTGASQAWFFQHGDDLAAATQADSVQIRYNLQCIPFFAFDHLTCGDVVYGVLYDNLRLELITGVPAPIFNIFVGDPAQSMFVDGGIAGSVGCAAGTIAARQCWPGVRGSDVVGGPGNPDLDIHDNFNSTGGDSLTPALATGLRKNGKGINWRRAYSKSFANGTTILPDPNPIFVAAYDAPRMIFRIFDPTSKTWSPWDSSELDVDNLQVSAGDTVLVENTFRTDWPPRDKVAAGASLPGGFSVTPLGGSPITLYSALNFFPRGARVQYYWKAVDINGGTSYQFSSDALAREVEDLPTLPGSSIVAPDIIEFRVLPSVYPAGAAGTQLAGITDTPILDSDGSYTRWSFGTHATVQILRALGVRADRYRTMQGLGQGGHFGGHELAGTRVDRLSNYFPNKDEYGIADLLANQYRIWIESAHNSNTIIHDVADAALLNEWWSKSTGIDGGDRCVFVSGDDFFSTMLAPGNNAHQLNEASQTFGVASAANQWNGGNANQFPVIKDLFADPAAGPALGSGSFQYVVDGGCPAPNRFDALTKTGGSESANIATYPTFASVTNVAGVSNMKQSEPEDGATPDHDRNKALGYGFSIQYIRQGGTNLVDTRAQVLYKFLTSCRGPRTASDTASCWPCPTDANKYSNWLTSANFGTSTYGPLYLIQDATKVLTAVNAPSSAPVANRLQGNFPNPFNPETAIRFTSAGSGRVDVRIFDVAGRLVQTISKNVTQGVNEVRWNGKSSDGRNLASGVYFVKVKYPDGSESQDGLKVAIVR